MYEIFLGKENHLIRLIINDCYEKSQHLDIIKKLLESINLFKVDATLNKLIILSSFWIPEAKNYYENVISYVKILIISCQIA